MGESRRVRMRYFCKLAGPAVAALLTVTAAAALAKSLDHSDGPYTWTDPVSGGSITVTENVYIGCDCDAPDDTTVMTFEWVVKNIDYPCGTPACTCPGTPPDMDCDGQTNGLSGFEVIFAAPVSTPELHCQQNPSVAGPWDQNAFGQVPPTGVEWDVETTSTAGTPAGIPPGEAGSFSVCMAPRQDALVNVGNSGTSGFGPFGWAHTWSSPAAAPDFPNQVYVFYGQNSVPGDLLVPTNTPTATPVDTLTQTATATVTNTPTASQTATLTATATQTLTPSSTSTATQTRTPTRTRVPEGGPCMQTFDCQAGLACINNVCTRVVTTPTTSSTGLLIGLFVLGVVAALSLWRPHASSPE